MLHRPLCLEDAASVDAGLPPGSAVAVDPEGELMVVAGDLRVLARSEGVRALPDAEPAALHLGGAAWAVAVLAEPTQRYRSGLLGDEVEAGSVVLLSLPGLDELARWRPEAPAVIEERRAVPWHAGGASGLHVTVSGEGAGARLLTLEYAEHGFRVVAEGPELPPGRGWLHVLPTPGARVYAQHHPHERGPVVRYAFGHALAAGDPAPAAHRLGASALDVASHVLGERNLDRAVWVRELAAGVDLLAIPRSDQRALTWLRCDAARCDPVATSELPAPLATNLAPVVDVGEVLGLLAADAAGSVWWLPVPGPTER